MRALHNILQMLVRRTEAVPQLRFAAVAAVDQAKLWKSDEMATRRHARSIDAEGEVHTRLVYALKRLNDSAEALPRVRPAAEAVPDQAEMWRRLARISAEAGNTENEIAAWRRVLLINGKDAKAHARLAEILPTLGRGVEAIPHLRFVAEAAPGRAKLWRRLARALADAGDTEAEIDAWRCALSVDKDDSEAHARLADILSMAGRSAEAIPHLRYVAEEAPDQAKHWKRLARALADIGDGRKELAAWRHVLSIASDDLHAHARVGQLLQRLDRSAEAASHLTLAAEAIPHHVNPQTEFEIRYYSFLVAHLTELVPLSSIRSEPTPSPKERKLDCLVGALQSKWPRGGIAVRAGSDQGLSASVLGHAVRFTMGHAEPNRPSHREICYQSDDEPHPSELPANVHAIGDPLQQSLDEFSRKVQDSIGFLYISYDTYSSVRQVFRALDPRIGVGTVIVFDKLLNFRGFENEAFLALYDFLLERGLDFTWVCGYGRVIDFSTYLITYDSLPAKIRDWLSFGFEQEFAIRIIAGNPLLPVCSNADARLGKLAEALRELRPLKASPHRSIGSAA